MSPIDIRQDTSLNMYIEDPCTELGITTYTMWYRHSPSNPVIP